MTEHKLSKRHPQGIEVRHARSCPAKGWEPCRCNPSYQAWVYDKRTGERPRKTFPTLAAAKSWRADKLHALRHGARIVQTKDTVDMAADALLTGMRDGTISARGGKRYKPSVIRSYEQDLRNYIRPEFGHRKLADVEHLEIQDFMDALHGQRLSRSKINNAMNPLRRIYRRAYKREGLPNPMLYLDLPVKDEKPRIRVALPEVVVRLLDVLPTPEDKKLWATFFYTGARDAELMATQGEDVDLERGLLRIYRSWDKVVGFIETKNRKDRFVPISEHLHAYLTKPGRGFYFGTASEPFNYGKMTRRAYKAWKDAGLERYTPHECRHTLRTWLDEIPSLTDVRRDYYMEHSNTSMAARYTHPGAEVMAKDAAALDEYLTASEDRTLIPFPVARSVAQ